MNASRVSDIKRRLEEGRYRVDPYLVADAIIRWSERHPDGRQGLQARPQNECSKPASSSSVSMKTVPAGPSTTAPIQISPALV